MNRLTFFVDVDNGAEPIGRDLGTVFDLRLLPIGMIRDTAPGMFQVFDVDLEDNAHLGEIKNWLKRRPIGSKVIFAVDKTSRADKVQAYALGATDIIHRPITSKALLKVLLGNLDALVEDRGQPPLRSFQAVGPVIDALANVFSSACLGAPIDFEKLNAAGKELVKCIEAHGLESWIRIVRRHHSRTYQHSLIVTGVAVAFGQNLGFSARDREELSFAGILHDIGKARIPISILEKRGALDADETAIMRKHPEYGFDVLASVPGLSNNMLDMVVHHHEYLDGSGYPHGLKADEISDLVRIITISDIFSTLIEECSYRPAMSGEMAYQTLLGMGPKLDMELVREFRFAAAFKVVVPSQQPMFFSTALE
jgi:putative nucleotidyltransferase with HDIG domain